MLTFAVCNSKGACISAYHAANVDLDFCAIFTYCSYSNSFHHTHNVVMQMLLTQIINRRYVLSRYKHTCFTYYAFNFHALKSRSMSSEAHYIYSETPVMWTPLKPTQSVLIREVSLFQGLFNIRKVLSWPHACSVRITSGTSHAKEI